MLGQGDLALAAAAQEPNEGVAGENGIGARRHPRIRQSDADDPVVRCLFGEKRSTGVGRSSFMSTPSWADGWGSRRLAADLRDQVLSRRQARRMSRRFAEVGVGIPPARLQELAAGAPFSDDESADVKFALAATEIQRQARLAEFAQRRRRCIWWLIVAGLVLVALNSLVCMAYIVLSVAQHAF